MAFIITNLLAQGIYAGIIGTISTVTMGTCSLVKKIYTHQNPDVSKVIKELDLDHRLKLVKSVLSVLNEKFPEKKLLSDLEKTQVFELVGKEPDAKLDPIEICLQSLHLIIQEINKDLEQIDRKVAYHQTKWFNGWRKLNIKSYLENLKTNSALLKSRFDQLIQISLFLTNNQ